MNYNTVLRSKETRCRPVTAEEASASLVGTANKKGRKGGK